ncbi:hypothetical protein WKI71_00545 [Streptomyces sp. MS1.AVA.1]|uniref:Transposase n=1 Tax=Streptomyces machairae TaxID=3134109 RepID=A0ABU8UFD5_9ACTN
MKVNGRDFGRVSVAGLIGRLKRLQHRPDILDGFLAGIGLAIDLPPPSH